MKYEPFGWHHWPDHFFLSYQFGRALGETQEGGGAVSECFQAASRMKPDLESWHLDLEELRRTATQCGVAYHHVPVPDCRPDELTTALHGILAILSNAEARGQRTFLHCNAGLNRAPTVAIAFLHAHGGLSLAAACALVKSRRACGPYMRVLEAYFAA